MGLHLSAKPPPFQDLVQHKKAEREIAGATLCVPGIFTTSAPGIVDRIPTLCRGECLVQPNSYRASADMFPANWRLANVSVEALFLLLCICKIGVIRIPFTIRSWLPFGYQRYETRLPVAKTIRNSKSKKSLQRNTFRHITGR